MLVGQSSANFLSACCLVGGRQRIHTNTEDAKKEHGEEDHSIPPTHTLGLDLLYDAER